MKLVIVAGLALTTSLLAIDKEPAKRLGEAAAVFSEIMATPDKGIPQDLLENAHCIVIVPDSRPRLSSLAASTEKDICPAVTRAAPAGRRPPRFASRAAASASRSAAPRRT